MSIHSRTLLPPPLPPLQISKALLGEDERLKLRWDEAADGEVRIPSCWSPLRLWLRPPLLFPTAPLSAPPAAAPPLLLHVPPAALHAAIPGSTQLPAHRAVPVPQLTTATAPASPPSRPGLACRSPSRTWRTRLRS